MRVLDWLKKNMYEPCFVFAYSASRRSASL
jgi:hypothetical protein